MFIVLDKLPKQPFLFWGDSLPCHAVFFIISFNSQSKGFFRMNSSFTAIRKADLNTPRMEVMLLKLFYLLFVIFAATSAYPTFLPNQSFCFQIHHFSTGL